MRWPISGGVAAVAGKADHLALEELWRLRRSAHRFMSKHAAIWWRGFSEGGVDVVVPPELAKLPPRQRFSAMAKAEQRRIVRSRLFQLDEAACDAAATLGAKIRTAGHANAVARAGHPNVVESFGITTPAPYGFLRWASPIGYGTTWGAPVRVCHWGPHDDETSIIMWGDSDAVADAMIAMQPDLQPISEMLLDFTGPIYPETSIPLGPSQPAPAPNLAPADIAAEQVDEDIAMIYTIVATWLLLTRPGAATLTSHEPTPAQAAADRRAGLHHSEITHAAGTDLPDIVVL